MATNCPASHVGAKGLCRSEDQNLNRTEAPTF